jgi:hypothetical protein
VATKARVRGLPALPWRQGALFDELAAMGFRIRTVVGSGPVIEPARHRGARLFSFDEAENARGGEALGRDRRADEVRPLSGPRKAVYSS